MPNKKRALGLKKWTHHGEGQVDNCLMEGTFGRCNVTLYSRSHLISYVLNNEA